MQAGSLNKIIYIQKQKKVSDGMGGFTTTWVDLVTGTSLKTPIAAAIWPLSAKEQITGDQEIGTVTHKIRIRYRPGPKASMRVQFNDLYFGIIGPPINPNFSNRMLDLICKEVEV